MFQQERDYRGLEPKLGWVHTVAHGADLLWRLAAHPATTPEQRTQLLQALNTQVARPGLPAYVFNEADRLARVAVVIARSNPPPKMQDWLQTVADPAPMTRWTEAFQSPAGMARLHNVKQFLRALREGLAKSEPSPRLLQAVDAVLSPLP